jgi:outer membrane protein TolC
MRARRGSWIFLPAAVLLLALCGCQSPGGRPEIAQSPAPVCSFAATDLSRLSAQAKQPNTENPSTRTPDIETFRTIQTVNGVDESPVVADSQPAARAAVQPILSGGTPLLPLTLDLAIATALDENPTLTALRASQPVAEAAYRVAETYPFNPYVQVEVCPVDRELGTGQAAIKNYVYFMQTLELAHQQRYREASARASRNQVNWNVVQAELTNAAMTERLYFTALYQRDLRDLAKLTASLNEDLLGVVERRFKAATGTPAEQTTARVAARQSRKQADLAEENFQTAVLALKRQLNLDSGEPIELIGRLENFTWLPVEGMEPNSVNNTAPNEIGPIHVSTDVVARLASERPDVMAAQSATSMAQANADLARANMVQNVAVGPYYERDELGTLFFGVRAQVNVPIWDTGRPLANQRAAEVAQQATTAAGVRARAQVEAQTAIERYERARGLAARERADFSKTISEQLQRVRHQFDAGLVDILYLFTIQNSLLQEHRTYLDLLNEVAQAASDVTLAAGLPPARVVSGKASEVPLPPAAPPAM